MTAVRDARKTNPTPTKQLVGVVQLKSAVPVACMDCIRIHSCCDCGMNHVLCKSAVACGFQNVREKWRNPCVLSRFNVVAHACKASMLRCDERAWVAGMNTYA
jgi:hypothetical protein